jgi:peptide/nickel transport system permease protein
MTRYIIRRILQAIPLLFIISLMIFVLLRSSGDPLASMGGRRATRPEDRERLSRLLGLDQPLHIQYITWLIGNDWKLVDIDGDGVPETPGIRKGALRGDFGNSLVKRGVPALNIIIQRLPNTILLMVPAEIIILVVSLAVGIYSALKQYSAMDQIVTAGSFFTSSLLISGNGDFPTCRQLVCLIQKLGKLSLR